jgi:broad specificity phosphatase PhoE
MRLRSGPRALWLVRHGQSEGNVIRDRAEGEHQEEYVLGMRDADVPLSALGERQATAFGRWLAEQPRDRRPTAVLSSPYLRARQTAALIVGSAREAVGRLPVEIDERLRDREMGEWDGLTWRGILARHPHEAERAVLVGRYFHRPPGGESWADMTLRLRCVLADIARDLRDERVLVVAHDIPIQLVRAVYDGLDERATVELVQRNAYANCALTAYERTGDGHHMTAYNFTVPVEERGEPATEEPDVPAGR